MEMMPGRLIRNTQHDTDAGIIATYTNPLTGKHVSVYDGEKQGLDTDGGKYTIVCHAHSNTLSHGNRSHATWLARNATDWCEGCMEEAESLQSLVKEIKASVREAG